MGTKIVLDTNVIISAFGWKGSPHRILKRCIKGDLRLFTSPLLIAELSKVLSYKKFNFHQDEIDEFISITLETAELVEPNFKLSLITDDPSDNRILECALAGKCEYIITGDKHLINYKKGFDHMSGPFLLEPIPKRLTKDHRFRNRLKRLERITKKVKRRPPIHRI